jgi:hypothetical protein
MIEIRFDKTKDEVALLIWFLVDHSVFRTSAFSLLELFFFHLVPVFFFTGVNIFFI